MDQQKYTLDEARERLENYCALQERSHRQIQQKLHKWGIYGDAAEEIITALIQENYLNESRFAEAYAQGKFRMNKWGKIKIQQGLNQHGVSDYNISKSLEVIDEKDYNACMKKLALQKLKTLSDSLPPYEKKYKVSSYLAQKGFSFDEINGILDQMSF